MNLFFSLYLIRLSFQFVSSRICSEGLHEAFKTGFNLTEKCEECLVLGHGIAFRGTNWTGFCYKNEHFLFPNHESEENDNGNYFTRATERGCEMIEVGSHRDFDEKCMQKYKSLKCGFEGFSDVGKQDLLWKTTPLIGLFGRPTTETTTTTTREPPTSTTTTDTTTTREPSTSTPTTHTTTTRERSTSTTTTTTTIFTTKTHKTSTPPTTSSIQWTTTSNKPKNNFCESNEEAFGGHCYFLKPYRMVLTYDNKSYKIHKQNPRKEIFWLSTQINSTESCNIQHPKALGLAVETEEENNFVLGFLKTIRWYNKSVILTSGIRSFNNSNEWRGWNTPINNNILNVTGNASVLGDLLYCIDPCNSRWVLQRVDLQGDDEKNMIIMCEREENPKNILNELHKLCLNLYRNSSCYNTVKHVNYCCARDENGEIWFGCPNTIVKKSFEKGFTCTWGCKDDGLFDHQLPKCLGSHCSAIYNGISYKGPVAKHALSECPKNFSGLSSWYCQQNRKFLGTPNYQLCCEPPGKLCKDIDSFLNVWMACPLKTAIKMTACPANSVLKEAFVVWHCQENGTFIESGPDYSLCNVSMNFCEKEDRYGRTWKEWPGRTAEKDCPSTFTGKCFWKCQASGEFDGDEPDCSSCRAAWMNEVSDKINEEAKHDEILKLLEKYTKEEDLRIGYGHVLNLTSGCVTLFKKQNPKNEIPVFDHFMRDYSKLLKNIAGDTNVWSSFSVMNRREFANSILTTTQTATFANLETQNVSSEVYNATLTDFETDGFELFVAYNPEMKGSRFPLQDFFQNNWQIEIKEVLKSGPTFAAMGLVMNHSLSSLMFPKGNGTKELEMNAPAITFTLATSIDGKVVVLPNVTVDISFKHVNKTRFPINQIIRRRLHKGERPAGVYNSTLCYYYSLTDWSTDGCSVTFTSKEQTNCICRHLSTIGLLMSIHKYEPDSILEVISIVCSSITIVSLILALVVFYHFDGVKNDRAFIGKNLCACLLLGHFMILTVMDKKFFYISDQLCTAYAVLLHYVFTAAFAWMFVEGCHLYRMLVLVFDSNIEYRYIYLSIGYGVPFVIVGMTELFGIIFQEQPYGQDELCWLKGPNYIWAFVGPVVVSTSINLFILIIAMKLAISSKITTERSRFANLKIWIKGWISLSTLLGITWLFGLSYIHYDEVFIYTFSVFNGLQGFFIFLFRCLLSDQYKTCILRKMKFWFSKSQSDNRKKSENIKTDTKVFVIGGSKSISEKADSGYDPSIPSGSEKLMQETSLKTTRVSHPRAKPKLKNKWSVSDMEVTLKPAISEAYLRNKLIEKNLFARKRQTERINRREGSFWLENGEEFPELSHHYYDKGD